VFGQQATRQQAREDNKVIQPETDLHETNSDLILHAKPIDNNGFKRNGSRNGRPFVVIGGQLQKENELKQEAQGLYRG